MSTDLQGKVALVTGATSGIGLETAAALAGRGATVILGVRNTKTGKEVAEQIKKRHPGAKVEVNAPLDLYSMDSIRKFADEVNSKYSNLHILVNNAGVSFMTRCFTEDGVGGIAQTNHLGPYTLTRLLERKLVASKARVVTVASVLHRTTRIKDAKGLLTDWRQGYYEHTKLANVLFGYELQRRLGNHGVQSVVADPGGVRSSIWDKTPIFKKGFARTLIDMCYSPPEDGCQSVVHAATVPWDKERKVVHGRPALPAEDLRYYSRGLFNHPFLTNGNGYRGKEVGLVQKVVGTIWGVNTLLCGFFDYPLRKLTGGALFSTTKPVRSAKQSYDTKLAEELWNESAEIAKVPRTPAI
mmetsp:Transcript_24448/g.53399  ORF Transcript_24448/g.53399 Transcript_24448/m.53399 type:complete len:355 (+) Transcript_24448:113-1177(+)